MSGAANDPRAGDRARSRGGRSVRWAAVFAALAFGHVPLLAHYVRHLRERPHYEFVALLPLTVGWLARDRLRGSGADGRVVRTRPNGVWTIALFGAGLAIAVWAALIWSRWANAVGALLTVMGGVYAWGGAALLRRLAPALLLLATAIHAPLGLDFRALGVLRGWAVRGACGLLDLARVPCDRHGRTIEIPGRTLLIDDACSGIQSVLAVCVVTLFAGLLVRRSARRIVGLCVVGIVFAVGLNAVRIAAGAWAYDRWGVDWLSGARHELVGAACFAACLGLVWSADRAVSWVFCVPGRGRVPDSKASGDGGSRGRPTRVLVGVAAAYVLCGAFQLRQAYALGVWPWAAATQAPTLRADARFELPDRLAGWERADAEAARAADVQTVGAQARRWFFRRGRLVVGVAIDYPYRGYHELTACYVNAGWEVGASSPVRAAGGAGFELTSPPKHAVLCFALFDARGRWLAPGGDDVGSQFRRRMAGTPEDVAGTEAYQVQAFAPAYGRLAAEERGWVRELFREARERLMRQALEQVGSR